MCPMKNSDRTLLAFGRNVARTRADRGFSQDKLAEKADLIAEANRGNVIVLTDGQQKVTLQPGAALDLEEDRPELEAELLKAIDGS
jgi:hypothetical protein